MAFYKKKQLGKKEQEETQLYKPKQHPMAMRKYIPQRKKIAGTPTSR